MDRSDIPVSRIGRREIFRKKPIKKPEKGFPANEKTLKGQIKSQNCLTSINGAAAIQEFQPTPLLIGQGTWKTGWTG